jgi:hypothetical protein
MENEVPLEVEEQVLASSLGPVERGAAKALKAWALPAKRATRVRNGNPDYRLAAERLLQSPRCPMDRVALGHSFEARWRGDGLVGGPGRNVLLVPRTGIVGGRGSLVRTHLGTRRLR